MPFCFFGGGQKLNRTEQVQDLEDFEILKKIINNEIDMKDIDYNTKIRLINLCEKRTKQIQQKIKDLENK